MSKIDIPTPDELRGSLKGLDRLATATQWERAAIVFAYTRGDDKGGRPTANPLTSEQVSDRLTITAFAAEGYHGLGSRNTIAAYRTNWEAAMESGDAVATEPGMTRVELPDLPWPAPGGPSVGHTRGKSYARKDATAEEKAEVVRHLLTPDVVEVMRGGPIDDQARIISITPTDDMNLRAIADGGKVSPPTPRPRTAVEELAAAALAIEVDRDTESGALALVAAMDAALDKLAAGGPYTEDSPVGQALTAHFSRSWDLLDARVQS